jgi:hypothetical protein
MLAELIRITSAVADVGSTRGCVTIVQHERSHASKHLRGSGNEAGLRGADTDQESKPGCRHGSRSVSSCPYRVTRQRGNSGGDQNPRLFPITQTTGALLSPAAARQPFYPFPPGSLPFGQRLAS